MLFRRVGIDTTMRKPQGRRKLKELSLECCVQDSIFIAAGSISPPEIFSPRPFSDTTCRKHQNTMSPTAPHPTTCKTETAKSISPTERRTLLIRPQDQENGRG